MAATEAASKAAPAGVHTPVVVVRHGQTVRAGAVIAAGRAARAAPCTQAWNAVHRLQGFANSTLTDVGVEQAKQAAAFIAEQYGPVGGVVSSDLARAAATAAAIADATGAPLRTDSRLRETNLGVVQGLSWAVAEEAHGQELEAWGEDCRVVLPGGESAAGKFCRISTALAEALAGHTGPGALVVVVHGGVVREIVRAAEGTPLLTPSAGHIGNASITRLTWEGKGGAPPLPSELTYGDVVPDGTAACAAAYTARGQGGEAAAGALTLHGAEVLAPDDSMRAVPLPVTTAQWEAGCVGEEPLEAALVAHSALAVGGRLRLLEAGITAHLSTVT